MLMTKKGNLTKNVAGSNTPSLNPNCCCFFMLLFCFVLFLSPLAVRVKDNSPPSHNLGNRKAMTMTLKGLILFSKMYPLSSAKRCDDTQLRLNYCLTAGILHSWIDRLPQNFRKPPQLTQVVKTNKGMS